MTMEFDFAEVLLQVMERKASDLHLTAGSPPMIRHHGRLHAMDYPKMTPQLTREVIYSILTNEQRQRLETDWQIDLAYSIPGKARFRVNAYMQRAALSAAFRLIPHEMPKLNSLGLKAALRQDPDVILVGEMRDLETISTALTAAETGHLVFATLHTQDTAQTVDRIVDVFPPEQQQQVRVQLSVSLQGIVTQQLLPKADGQGRVVGTEVLVPTPAVRNLIREGKTHQIYSALQTGASHGMQTMDTSLAQLVREQKITRELAEARSGTPEELRRLMGTVRVA